MRQSIMDLIEHPTAMNQISMNQIQLETPDQVALPLVDEFEKTMGGRLKIARLLTGYLQKSIIQAKGFPHIPLAVFKEWEKSGIPSEYLEEVANFFTVKGEIFNPKLTSDEAFWDVISSCSMPSNLH